jgi:2-dehydro-3-deoxyphosphogluconate aldolase / (4S)-4-hydroxy-2-oxoglutarate aldolase
VDITAIARLAPVIPVLTVQGPADGVPLARALARGGLRAIEVTLRTAGALEALKAIAAEVPEAVPGAGTVLDARQLDAAQAAGARFFVSPGCTPGLARAARQAGAAYLPGIQTVSEAMAMAELGHHLLKFFPASAAGGTDWLKSVAAPLGGLSFCPTGGITAESASQYLSLANVACVGGSWVAPAKAVAAQDWGAVERLAVAASELKGR